MKYLTTVLALLVLTTFAFGAGTPAPKMPGPKDKCPVCGMFVAKYPDFVSHLVFKGGTEMFFDGVKDLMKYYFDLAKYNPGKKTGDIAAIYVTDYYTLKLIDGHQAYYVVGSDVYGPMGRELIPFGDQKAAQEFLKDHQGKMLLKFSEITPAVIKTLD